MVKPWDNQRLVDTLTKARQAEDQNANRKEKTPLRGENVLRKSTADRELLALLDRVPPPMPTVLITGEKFTPARRFLPTTCTGSTTLTRKPMAHVDMGAITPLLFESELFGHYQGCFYRRSDRVGKMAEADGGTLFLDEIGNLALEMAGEAPRGATKARSGKCV